MQGSFASEGIKFSNFGLNYYRKFNHRQSLSAQKNLKAIESAALSIDLKLGYLSTKINDPIIERSFARYYWEIGLAAYPKYKSLSKCLINKATKLGYNGKKYAGGPKGQVVARYLGWRAARFLLYYFTTIS